jgi:hypothetical protein
MDRTKNRVAITIAVIVVAAGLLACGTGGLIGRQEEPSATPTKTPKPTFTSTLTPSVTPIPTDTPLPTDTPSPMPPTNTPIIMTATFTPSSTATPSPEPPTNTPAPTKKPTSKPKPTATKTRTPAPPTNTPKPTFAWTGTITSQLPNCGTTQAQGFTLAQNGGLAGDIWVHYWADSLGFWAKSDWVGKGGDTPWLGDERNWDALIGPGVRPGTWHVCVVDKNNSSTCQSNTVDAVFNSNCDTGVQIVNITFRKN